MEGERACWTEEGECEEGVKREGIASRKGRRRATGFLLRLWRWSRSGDIEVETGGNKSESLRSAMANRRTRSLCTAISGIATRWPMTSALVPFIPSPRILDGLDIEHLLAPVGQVFCCAAAFR